ncbi:MAG: helix-turn-helix domain-containing protein [Phycisphaeraceae bacterium]
MGKHYDQLDLDDHIEISRLHTAGRSRREIGRLMGRDASTISRGP